MKRALITGITGQDGAIWPNLCCKKAMTCTGSSGARPRPTPRASTICIRTRTRPGGAFMWCILQQDAPEKLGWSATATLEEMVAEMVTSDLEVVKGEQNRKDRDG